MSGITLETIRGLTEIAAADWDRCAAAAGGADHPFICHGFLSALEDAGCVGPGTGWQPCHVVLKQAGRVAGVAPAYLKSHSQGEYVFDHGWAEALERAGGRYYPKLQCAVPFTPVTGPRLLAGTAGERALLARGLAAAAAQLGASSAHVTFLAADDAAAFDQDWLTREDIQFHWRNEGYGSFDDFLGALSSSRRKVIRRERREVAARGIDFVVKRGREINEDDWDHFFAFYMDTGSRKWGRPYLTRAFFSMMAERLGEAPLLFLARRVGKVIAGALNLVGGDRLYGRYWGTVEDHPFLHFEASYYQAMEWAIAHGIAMVEAGAQGEHKLARGYLPVVTGSRHFIRHAGLARAVADYLTRERQEVAATRAALLAESPFRVR